MIKCERRVLSIKHNLIETFKTIKHLYVQLDTCGYLNPLKFDVDLLFKHFLFLFVFRKVFGNKYNHNY